MTLGEKIRQLREQKGLAQRQVAACLEIDTALVSKIECNEKRIKRSHLKKLSGLFEVDEEELQKLWLADKVYQVIREEPLGHDALKIAEEQVLYIKSKKI